MKNNMKLYELTFNENGIRFRHANPRPLTAEQKTTITITLTIVIAVVVFFLGLFATMR
mgnify:CR=1 FL=1